MKDMATKLIPLLMVVCSTGCNERALSGTDPVDLLTKDLAAPVQFDASIPLSLPPKYTFDFSSSVGGGVLLGNAVNIALSFDEKDPIKKYDLSNDQFFERPNLYVSNDNGTCYSGTVEPKAGKLTSGNLDDIDFAVVTFVSPLDGPDTQGGAVCSGYLDAGGLWHWNKTLFPVKESSGTYRARVSFTQRQVAAIKLRFDTNREHVSSISIGVLTK